MNDSPNMQDQFRIIIVNDRESTVKPLETLFGGRGYNVQGVTGDVDYPKQTYEAIEETYKENKVPILLLDENLKPWSPIDGTEMMVEIVKRFKEGGIFLPGSLDISSQLTSWEENIPQQSNGWRIEKWDTMSGIDHKELDRILTDYLDTKESKSEFKNR